MANGVTVRRFDSVRANLPARDEYRNEFVVASTVKIVVRIKGMVIADISALTELADSMNHAKGW